MWKHAERQSRPRGALGWVLLSVALGLSNQPSPAFGSEFDPTLAQAFSVAPARVMSGQSEVPLPRAPQVKWRVRVAGGILHPPSVAQGGAVLLALATPTLVQYDARGKLEWSARLGASPAAQSAIVLGDGTRLVLTQGGEALAFSPRGRLQRHTTLPFASLDASASVAASEDGGLLIATGRRLARLDAALHVVFATRLDYELRNVLPGSPALAVASNGAVLELTESGEALRRGSFAGRIDAIARLGPRRVAAVLDGRRLSELDLDTGTLTTRLAESDLDLSSALGSNAQGELRVVAAGEFLVALGRDGREKFRAALPTHGSGPAGTGFGRATSSSELLVGPDGSALVVRAGLDVIAVQPDGSVSRAEGSACAEPLRPAGLAPKSAVYACRSGIVLRLDDAK